MRRRWRGRLVEAAFLLAVTALAATLRGVALGQVPPGLYHDEACNGLDALQVLSGHWPVYFAANHGREPFYIYLAALSIGLLGRTPTALRLAATIVGTLTIPATAMLARSWFGRRTGLLSGAVLAVTLWHVHLSRVAFRAVTLPLLVALALWAGTRAWRSNRWTRWLLAGLLCGACFYTYLPARLTPAVLSLWVGIVALHERAKKLWPGAAWFVLGAALALIPLGLYTVGHWGVVAGRPGAVSILNPLINKGDLVGTFVRHLGSTLGMFFVRGDAIPRHNLPGRPVFDPVMGLAMLAGTAWAVLQARRRLAPALLLTWLGVMSLPTLLAEDAPHFLRATGLLPLLAVLPALGLGTAWKWLERRGQGIWGGVLALLVIAAGLGLTCRDYFVRYPARPEVGLFFEEAATHLAADVNSFLGVGWDGKGWSTREGAPLPDRQAFVERRLWEEWAAVPFLVPATEAVTARPEEVVSQGETLLVLWPHGDYQARLALLPQPARIRVWEGPPAQGDLDPAPFIAYVAFAAGPTSARQAEPVARFEEGITLVEASTISHEREWQVELTWEATAPPRADYTVFVHLADGDTLLDQADGEPAGGYYPTSMWRAGDQVVDVHSLASPQAWSNTPRLTTGLYLRSTLERLSVVDAEGRAVGEEVILPTPLP